MFLIEGNDLCATDGLFAVDHYKAGRIWSRQEIEERKERLIEVGKPWQIVDDLVIDDEIKAGGDNFMQFIDSYSANLINLAHAGVKVVHYNFNPVFFNLYTHSIALFPDEEATPLFDQVAFAVFDIYLLQREGAENSYNDFQCQAAKRFNRLLSNHEKQILQRNILSCMQNQKMASLEGLSELLRMYAGVSNLKLKENLELFRLFVFPLANKLDLKMKYDSALLPSGVLDLPSLPIMYEGDKWS